MPLGFDISVGAYDSLDVAGFFKPTLNGTGMIAA
jgi:hypothetical protein